MYFSLFVIFTACTIFITLNLPLFLVCSYRNVPTDIIRTTYSSNLLTSHYLDAAPAVKKCTKVTKVDVWITWDYSYELSRENLLSYYDHARKYKVNMYFMWLTYKPLSIETSTEKFWQCQNLLQTSTLRDSVWSCNYHLHSSNKGAPSQRVFTSCYYFLFS